MGKPHHLSLSSNPSDSHYGLDSHAPIVRTDLWCQNQLQPLCYELGMPYVGRHSNLAFHG